MKIEEKGFCKGMTTIGNTFVLFSHFFLFVSFCFLLFSLSSFSFFSPDRVGAFASMDDKNLLHEVSPLHLLFSSPFLPPSHSSSFFFSFLINIDIKSCWGW